MVAPTSTLSTSGVAGLVGGDEAALAMAAVHVYERRQWLGWYNSPGSYHIAKRLRLLGNSKILDSFSPGVDIDHTKLVKLDFTKGPKFTAARSGTVIEDTGHVGSLLMKECAAREVTTISEGSKTDIVGVTVVELNPVPLARMYPEHVNPDTPFSASIPIAVSLSCCTLCVIVFADWCAFSLILLGILANGISSLVIGSGKLQFTHPNHAKGSPAGDGILVLGKKIVLLKGTEGAVNSITRGSFSLNFKEAKFRQIEWTEWIGWCSALFTIQFFAQLLLIPQASVSGQNLFVVSLGVSWFYNSWLASKDKEGKIQRDILFDSVLKNPALTKHTLGTFTSAIVFSLLVLEPDEPDRFLNELLPNDTKVWRQWRKTIVQLISKKEKFEFADAGKADGLTPEQDELLKKLYGYAKAAHNVYTEHLRFSRLSMDGGSNADRTSQ